MTKSIGDPREGPHSLFICPYMGRAYECFAMLGGAVGGVEEKLNHIIDTQLHEYDVFIDAEEGATPKPGAVADPCGAPRNAGVQGGTESSNLLCSSSQSVSAVNPEAIGEKPRTLAAVCGWLGT